MNVQDPDSLAGELFDYLFMHMAGVEPLKRRRCGWVMNIEWMNECRKIARELGYFPPLRSSDREYMLGLPILEPRDDGGVPHLEVID